MHWSSLHRRLYDVPCIVNQKMFITSTKDKAQKINERQIRLLKDIWTCHVNVWNTQERSLIVKLYCCQHSSGCEQSHIHGSTCPQKSKDPGKQFYTVTTGPCSICGSYRGPRTHSFSRSLKYNWSRSTCYPIRPPTPAGRREKDC